LARVATASVEFDRYLGFCQGDIQGGSTMAISNLMILVGDNNSISAPSDWTRIDQDLNEGAGGKFIYLAYKDEESGPFITDITFVVGDSADVATPAGYTRLRDDLNAGAGGKFIYLCFLRGPGLPITNLGISSTTTPLPCGDGPFYTLIPQDLNQGASGRYIYLCTGRYRSRWMEDLSPFIEKRPLNRIALPGTHDSGTSTLSRDSAISRDASSTIWNAGLTPGIKSRVYDWALAQNLSVADQLQSGIRYLDIRVLDNRLVETFDQDKAIADEAREKQIFIVHSMFGARIEVILDQVEAFLSKNLKEIVILRIGTNRSDSLSSRGKAYLMNDLVHKRLGDLMVPRSFGPQVTPGQLWAANKRLIVMVDSSIWSDMNPGGEIEWLWNEADDSARPQYKAMVLTSGLSAKGTGKLSVLKEALDKQQVSTYSATDRFQRLGCCLTPDDATVVAGSATDYLDSFTGSAFSGLIKATSGITVPKTLYEGCAMAATPAAARWMRSDWQNETVNIVTTDFFQISQTVDLCLLRNTRPRRFYLISANGLVVDLPGGSTQPGTKPIMWSHNTPQSTNQQWILESSGHIRSVLNPDMVLDIEGAKAVPGTPVILWSEHKPAAPNQLWELDSEGHIRSKLDSSLVLDIKNGSGDRGAELIVWPASTPISPNQFFTVREI
jgi:hypothetical protein